MRVLDAGADVGARHRVHLPGPAESNGALNGILATVTGTYVSIPWLGSTTWTIGQS